MKVQNIFFEEPKSPPLKWQRVYFLSFKPKGITKLKLRLLKKALMNPLIK